MIIADAPLNVVLANRHVLLRLDRDDLVIVTPDDLLPELRRRIEVNWFAITARLRREREDWIRHWRDLIAELIAQFVHYMSEDCTDQDHNRFVSLMNLVEYIDREVLRERYGLRGCPSEHGTCPSDAPVCCTHCAETDIWRDPPDAGR